MDGTVHFIAVDPSDSNQYGLWISDGTGPGTHFVVDPNGGSSVPIERPMSAAGRLFFQYQTGSVSIGAELWTSDGTAPGTYLVKEGSLYSFAAVGGFLYFEVAGTSELWRTDGTTTVMATSLPDTSGGSPHFTVVGK